MTLFSLSKKEQELMEILWNAGTPLGRTEILERAEKQKCTWKPNSIHILVNSLIDKGALRVSGYYIQSRKLGRTFESALTREDYAAMQVYLALEQGEKLLRGCPDWMSKAKSALPGLLETGA